MVPEVETPTDRLARLHREIQIAGSAYLLEIASSSSVEAARAVCEALSGVIYLLQGAQEYAVTKRDYLSRVEKYQDLFVGDHK